MKKSRENMRPQLCELSQGKRPHSYHLVRTQKVPGNPPPDAPRCPFPSLLRSRRFWLQQGGDSSAVRAVVPGSRLLKLIEMQWNSMFQCLDSSTGTRSSSVHLCESHLFCYTYQYFGLSLLLCIMLYIHIYMNDVCAWVYSHTHTTVDRLLLGWL